MAGASGNRRALGALLGGITPLPSRLLLFHAELLPYPLATSPNRRGRMTSSTPHTNYRSISEWLSWEAQVRL